MFDFTIDGVDFRAEYVPDENYGPPWKECDGHGPVREAKRSYYHSGLEKRPGERPLHIGGRNEYRYAYDWQAAMKQARADSWGGYWRPSTGGNCAPVCRARAVDADFEHLRGYLNDAWHYVGVCVVALNSDGEATAGKYDHALWGIESNAGEYLQDVAHELAGGILAERSVLWRAMLRESRARREWAKRGGVTV